MQSANTSARTYENTNLLVINNNKTQTTQLNRLTDHLKPGDIIVVNQSATIPADFNVILQRTMNSFNIRLAAFQGPDHGNLKNWKAIALGTGHWQQTTESRPDAPQLVPGDIVNFGDHLSAEITKVDPHYKRSIQLSFLGEQIQYYLYQYGKPIQYSYLQNPLQIWDQQSIFSCTATSVEPPSAALNFSWDMYLKLRQKGIRFTSIIHSAGISSTGDQNLDKQLPFPEWSYISAETAATINRTKAKGYRISALGTTVVRALESSVSNGKLQSKNALTTLKVRADTQLQIVDNLITGMHEPESSHLKLLCAFCPNTQINQGYTLAKRQDFKKHEYGDLALLSCS